MAQTSQKEKDEAWLGDAVLALYTRQWLLDDPPPSNLSRQELFIRMTANQFLNALGNPTSVEAKIAAHYRRGGLEDAFAFIEENLKPVFLQQLKNARKR